MTTKKKSPVRISKTNVSSKQSSKEAKSLNIQKWYPWILAFLAAVGFAASMILTIEKIAILKNPNHHLSCSINPLLSCGPIITSEEASAFGFPNPIIGLAAFSTLFTVAVGMLAGSVVEAKAKLYWRLYIVGHLFGLGFIAWLMSKAFYDLRALCVYCMVAWAVTIPLNWYGFLWMSSTGRLKLNPRFTKFRDWGLRNHWGIVLICYLFVFGLILAAFSDYFHTVWR